MYDLLTKQMQYILTKTKKEEDQKIIKKREDDLKEATQNLENFHRQVPLWSQLNWKMKRLLGFITGTILLEIKRCVNDCEVG